MPPEIREMMNMLKNRVVGYKLLAEGIKPVGEKVQAFTDGLRLKNLKDLRCFMDANN